MVFSAPIFLFGFLPIVILFYYLSPKALKNGLLLLASLVFYAWGEVFYVAIMLASIAINYLVGLLIARQQFADKEKQGFLILSLGVALNIALLVSFKYANFIVDNLNVLLGAVKIPELFLCLLYTSDAADES